MLAACSGDDDSSADAEALLAAYEEHRGTADVDAHMAISHEDLVVINHPLGADELDFAGYRTVEAPMRGEAFVANIEVDGDTATFNQSWLWQGNCYANPDPVTITIKDGLIVKWVFPESLDREDPPAETLENCQ